MKKKNINDTLLFLDTSSIEDQRTIHLLALYNITAIGITEGNPINFQPAGFWFLQAQLNETLKLIAVAVDLNLIVKIEDSKQYTLEELLKEDEIYNLFNNLPRLIQYITE